MKRTLILLLIIALSSPLLAQVGIGTASPDPSAILDLTSSSKGFLIPRVTNHSAIVSPAEGLIVYDLTTHSHWFFQNSSWMSLSSTPPAENPWRISGNTGNFLSSFIGTLDTVPIRFKVNNAPSGIIDYNKGNVAFGYRCYHSGLGTGNVALGANALENLTTGFNSIALGQNALLINLVGRGNIALGSNTLSDLLTGNANISIGENSSQQLSSGEANTVIGTNALNGWTAGDYNVVLGENVLHNNLTGSNNVAIGSKAGYLNLGGSNVFLGTNAGYNETGSNKLYIANSNTTTPLIWGDFANSILSTPGTMGIGTQTPTAALEVKTISPTIKITHGPGPSNSSSLLFADNTGDKMIISSGSVFNGINFLSSDGEIKTAGTHLKFTAQGAEDQLYLNNAGNVGIGTSSPTAKLHVVAASNPLQLEGLQKGVTTSVLVVDDKGVVGVNEEISQPALWGRNLAPDNTYLSNTADKLCIGTTLTTEKVNIGGSIFIAKGSSTFAKTIYVEGQPGGAGNNGSDLKIAAGAGSPQVGGSTLFLDGGVSSLYPGNTVISSIATGSVGIRTATPTSSITLTGSVGYSLTSASGTYTVTANDYIIVCTAATIVTLPNAPGIAGRTYTFKRTYPAGSPTTIVAASVQTIDGVSTYSIDAQWKFITIVSDGVNWLIIAKN